MLTPDDAHSCDLSPARHARQPRRWQLLVAAALLAPLLGIVTFLVLVAQPWANAVGGCGGG